MHSPSAASARLAVGLTLGLLAGDAAAVQGPVQLTASPDPVPLGHAVELLRDDGASLTFADVRRPEMAARFAAAATDAVVNHGIDTAPYWYRLALGNPAGSAAVVTDWVLEVQFPVLDYVDLHLVRHDGAVESFPTGDLRQPAAGQLPFRTFALPLRLEPGEAVTAYLRVQTAGRHSVGLVAWTRAGFDAHAARENLVYGAFFGMMLVMVLYNLAVFLWIRDRAYLWYVLYLAVTAVLGLLVAGYLRQHGNGLAASAPAWINGLWPYLAAAGALCAGLFTREFLQTRRDAPNWDRLLVLLIVMAATLLLLCPVLSYNTAARLGLMLAAASATATLLMAVVLSLRGLRAARFFLLAWGVSLGCIVLISLPAWRLLPPNFFTDNAWQVGVWLHVILLSLALADRVTTERREKVVARAAADRLKGFLPARVAELVGGGDTALLQPRRRNVTVLVVDLRGFTPFSESSAPEDVMNVLRQFYEAMGAIVEKHGGTVEHFAGDSMLVFFNAPLEVADPEEQAVRCALQMREAFDGLRRAWARLGHELGLGIGIADGYATIGAIGFSGRSQYAAIGAVTNLASRLCGVARHGEILTTGRVLAAVETLVEARPGGEQVIKGFQRAIPVVAIVRLKTAGAEATAPGATAS